MNQTEKLFNSYIGGGYADKGKIKLYHGDCIDIINEIPDGSVDLILTDPPYSSGGLHTGDRQKDTATKYTNNDSNGAARFPNFEGDNMDQRSFTEFMRMILFKLRLKVIDGGIAAVFIDWRNLPAMTDAMQMAGWIWRGVVPWNKKNSRPQKGRFRNQCEYIVWGSNGNMPFERGVPPLMGLVSAANVPTRKRNHQTEKPVEILKEIIQIVPEGCTVLDPFMGSGSAGVAAIETGRKFIGIELNEIYFEIAKARIKEAEITNHEKEL